MIFRRPRSIWERGENAAAHFMKRRGCRVIGRNIRIGPGEIDLLCRERNGAVVLVEVKARQYKSCVPDMPDPTASITARKRAKLILLAKHLKRRPEFAACPLRIDVVAVRFVHGQRRPVEIRHYPSAVSET